MVEYKGRLTLMANNEDNLIPMASRSSEEVRAIGRKGGIASGIRRRELKTFKDMAKAIMDLPLSEKEKKVLLKAGISPEDMPSTKKGLLIFSVSQKAITKGDSQAMMRIAELTGEHIDEKKIQLEGDGGQRTTINLMPKGGTIDVTLNNLTAEYVKGSAYGTDQE